MLGKESAASPALGHQQDTAVVTLRLFNETLEHAFDEINRQTSYRVVYANSLIERAQKVTIALHRVPVNVALNILLENQPFTYVVDGNNIIIVSKKVRSYKEKEILPPTSPNLPVDPISGTIVDSSGNPLSGASITIKGTKITTFSDSSGKFSIIAKVGDILVVTFVGYKERMVIVNGIQPILIPLSLEISGLDEITVLSTGYQDIPKARATGSFVKIDNELLNRAVSTNILDRIYNVTSGLNYDPRRAGSSVKSTISIRGVSTINADMKPLVVVDGFPYDESAIENGVIHNVNPNDIESITVLRDAAAASIWGARSGNGVIVITTKKGKYNQKTNIQFNSVITIGKKPDLYRLPVISSKEYLDMEKKLFTTNYYQSSEDMSAFGYPIPLSQGVEILIAKRDGTVSEADANKKLSELENHSIIDDIYSYFLQKSVHQQYALNVSGGTEKFRYYASIGLDKNKNNAIGDNKARWNIRLDNTYKPVKNIEVNNYIVYTQNNTKYASIDLMSLMPRGVGFYPTAPYTQLVDQYNKPLAIPRDYRLGYIDTISHPSILDWHYQPIDELRYINNTATQYSTRIGTSIKYSIINGLSINVRGQYEKTLTPERHYQSVESYYTRDLINQFADRYNSGVSYPVPLGSIVDLKNIEVASWNIRSQVDFDRKLGKFELNALAGWEASEFENDIQQRRDYGYNDDTHLSATNIDYNNTFIVSPWQNTARVPSGYSYYGSLRRLVSYYFNGALSYDSRYTISFSSRLDGANLFGVTINDKLLPLWSGGFAWNIAAEKFYRIDWLPSLKFRLSSGYNGNMKNDATRFATISYAPRDLILGIPIATLISPPNDRLKWEKVAMMNVGIDFSIIGRINGSIEYYHKKGMDLISSIRVDPTTGVSSYTGNNASIAGRGLDVNLNTINTVGKVKWETHLLFSYNTDKVTSYSVAPSVGGLTTVVGFNNPYVGKPLYSVFSYRWAGLDPATGDPRGYVKGLEANYSEVLLSKNTQPEDLFYNGPVNPKFFGSIRNDVFWKGFRLSVNVTYKLHSFFRRTSINYTNLFDNWGGHSDYSLRWQQPGDELHTTVPSMPPTTNYNRDAFYANSEVLVESGSYFRLQDIRFSYDIGKNLLKRLPFKNTQLYIYGNNLGLLWRANKYGIDPDYGDFVLAPSRTISIGLTSNF